MKQKRISLVILILLMIAVAWPSAAYAKGLRDDRVVFGGTFTLNEGETLDGNLIVLAGTARVDEGATVDGDMVLIGGTITLDGTVTGNLIGIGGAIRMHGTALVEGDLSVFAATLNRDEGARVYGEVITGLDDPATFNFQDDIQVPEIPLAPETPRVSVNFNPLVDFVWTVFRMFIWALVAILAVMVFPIHTERVAKAAFDEPLITSGAGLVTLVLAPFAMIALTITIILIPITIVATLALGVLWAFGTIAVGLEVGKRIAVMLKQDWAPAISAGFGTLVMMAVLIGFDALVPCVGWLPRTVVGFWGLGAVLLTRIGTQVYPEAPTGFGPPSGEIPPVVPPIAPDTPSAEPPQPAETPTVEPPQTEAPKVEEPPNMDDEAIPDPDPDPEE